ncbi:MAG: YoaK family protein [Brevundimonas sp.]|uniref:YoaK family protein n=1 Tax=Brevundimonas sp. TaxID=1871086 RepID=UPI00276102FB|nr:YoaK family protein [Brevundimonas sp.]MDP3401630.1 YoaK family protein [Brevundimonas sp.]MDZ4109834.1 YoaK family protein [Brevundimonas sp.]
MLQLDPRAKLLAACFSAVAGFVDVIGFLMTGGFFVSFMSGNSTRLGIGLAGGNWTAVVAGGLILTFVLGVVAGASVGRLARGYKEPAILGLVTGLLTVSLVMHWLDLGVLAAIPLALAMGAQNTVFAENGEVRVGLTYMTGTLVKLGKRITVALWGGERFGWVPFLLLWLGLLAGAVLGAAGFALFGANALIAAIVAMLGLTLVSATGPRGHSDRV